MYRMRKGVDSKDHITRLTDSNGHAHNKDLSKCPEVRVKQATLTATNIWLSSQSLALPSKARYNVFPSQK